MNLTEKHKLAFDNIQQIYKVGWTTPLPHMADIEPFFTCVADRKTATIATLRIGHEEQWEFSFTVRGEYYQFGHNTIPTVSQVQHIFQQLNTAAHTTKTAINHNDSYDLDTMELLVSSGWTLHEFNFEQGRKFLWLGRLFKGMTAELYKTNTHWIVDVLNYQFEYETPPTVRSIINRLVLAGFLIDDFDLYNLEETHIAKRKGWVLYGSKKNLAGKTVPLFVGKVTPGIAAFLHWMGNSWQINLPAYQTTCVEIPNLDEVTKFYNEGIELCP